MESAATILALGFTLGLRHALDADHLAAVATIVARNHRFRTAAGIGALWGLGHTASLLGVALLVILAGIHLPASWEVWTERGVAAMLAFLGGRLLWRLVRGDRLHNHPHAHGPVVHSHPHFHARGQETARAHTKRTAAATAAHHGLPGPRPFLVGLVHGLAGSGALMLLVATSIPDRVAGLLYVGVFGIGSVGGMLIMSAALSVPIGRAARHSSRLFDAAQAAAAVASLVIAAKIILR